MAAPCDSPNEVRVKRVPKVFMREELRGKREELEVPGGNSSFLTLPSSLNQ
jgi:hypothetical protein